MSGNNNANNNGNTSSNQAQSQVGTQGAVSQSIQVPKPQPSTMRLISESNFGISFERTTEEKK